MAFAQSYSRRLDCLTGFDADVFDLGMSHFVGKVLGSSRSCFAKDESLSILGKRDLVQPYTVQSCFMWRRQRMRSQMMQDQVSTQPSALFPICCQEQAGIMLQTVYDISHQDVANCEYASTCTQLMSCSILSAWLDAVSFQIPVCTSRGATVG